MCKMLLSLIGVVCVVGCSSGSSASPLEVASTLDAGSDSQPPAPDAGKGDAPAAADHELGADAPPGSDVVEAGPELDADAGADVGADVVTVDAPADVAQVDADDAGDAGADVVPDAGVVCATGFTSAATASGIGSAGAYGLEIRPSVDLTLTSLQFLNAGLADTIELRDTSCMLLASTPSPATQDPTVAVAWTLHAGTSYLLLSTAPLNSSTLQAPQFPYVDTANGITVEGPGFCGDGGAPFAWLNFDALTTCH